MSIKRFSGFTLVELLIVLTIIALLSSAGIAIYSGVARNGRDTRRQSDLRSIQSGLEQYNSDQFFYPNSPVTGAFPFGASLTSSTGNPAPPSSVKTYQSSVPIDPISAISTPYTYQRLPASCDNAAGVGGIRCIGYCLYTRMENSSNGVTVPPSCPAYTGTYNFAVTVP